MSSAERTTVVQLGRSGANAANGLKKREPAVDALLQLSGRKTFLRRPRAPSPLGDERASLPARWRAPARRSVRWRSRAPEVSAHALGAMPTTRLFGAPPSANASDEPPSLPPLPPLPPRRMHARRAVGFHGARSTRRRASGRRGEGRRVRASEAPRARRRRRVRGLGAPEAELRAEPGEGEEERRRARRRGGAQEGGRVPRGERDAIGQQEAQVRPEPPASRPPPAPARSRTPPPRK